jgi:hypothetical protein
MSYDPTSYLLFVLLIISGVALFLCILNFISLRELSARIREARRVPVRHEQDTRGSFYPEVKSGQESRTATWTAGDITSGIGLITNAYQLDSLIIASKDGLVVASSGSSDPEFDAAFYADLLSRNTGVPNTGVRLFEFTYGGMDLICIARGIDLPSDESEQWIKADIRTVFDTQLGLNPEISGETI